jgi:hypothetical protein
MHLHLVDDQENTVSVDVAGADEAKVVFEEALLKDPWIGATLRDDNDDFVDSFLRISEEGRDSHPLLDQATIDLCLKARSESREGFTHYEGPKWSIPGLCHEVSDYIQHFHGFARTSGTIMAKDCVTPICVHYWNVLPDLSVLDMTADQLLEGVDYRIIPKGHPDWFRYQPEFENPDEVEELRGEGVHSDELLDFIIETGKRIDHGAMASTPKQYLHVEPASEALKLKLEPLLTEFMKHALKDNEHSQDIIQKRNVSEGAEFCP